MIKKFRNRSEYLVQDSIRKVINRHLLELHEKVRIADIIDIDKISDSILRKYSLMGHFDFVLTDFDEMPISIIEYDGLGHSNKNDSKKNNICLSANIILVRIKEIKYIREFNKMDIVMFLVELIAYSRAFLEMKEQGVINQYEPFMMSGFLRKNPRHIFDSEFNFVVEGHSGIWREIINNNMNLDDLPPSINFLTLMSSDFLIKSFIYAECLDGPIVGTASLKIEIPSKGFLREIGQLWQEIGEFVHGMASESLVENIRFIGSGNKHVVGDFRDSIEEIKYLKEMGYALILGGGDPKSEYCLYDIYRNAKGPDSSHFLW